MAVLRDRVVEQLLFQSEPVLHGAVSPKIVGSRRDELGSVVLLRRVGGEDFVRVAERAVEQGRTLRIRGLLS